MSNQPAFKATKVSKYFGEVHALSEVSLSSEQGKIFGLLGPNGAGKTTLVNMLSTLTEPTAGKLEVLGVDVINNPNQVRKLIGLAGQFAAIDEYLTGEENIYMVARLYHLSAKEAKIRTKKLLEELSLADAAKRQVRTYSGGMRRRLDLGASLVGHPKVLFLDEPTTGLDPRTRSELWDIIRDLVNEGTSILLTTQYLEEADELADHIAVIDHGKLIAQGTSRQLKSQLGGDVIKFSLKNKNDIEKVMAVLKPLSSGKIIYEEKDNLVNLPVGSHGSRKLIDVVRKLDGAKIETVSFELHEPTLDDVFLNLTGIKASEVAEVKKSKKGWRK
jgi:ABC-2 type transport system ATP-binding protein